MSNIHTATSSMKRLSSYLHSLSQTPHRLRKRMLATWTPEQEFNQVRHRSGADMKRKLKWHDLVALGVGGMLGVGVFVTTGSVALHHSGPSVFISYIIAGISALLSSSVPLPALLCVLWKQHNCLVGRKFITHCLVRKEKIKTNPLVNIRYNLATHNFFYSKQTMMIQ